MRKISENFFTIRPGSLYICCASMGQGKSSLWKYILINWEKWYQEDEVSLPQLWIFPGGDSCDDFVTSAGKRFSCVSIKTGGVHTFEKEVRDMGEPPRTTVVLMDDFFLQTARELQAMMETIFKYIRYVNTSLL